VASTTRANGLGRWCHREPDSPALLASPETGLSLEAPPEVRRPVQSTFCGVRRAAGNERAADHGSARFNQPPFGQKVRRGSLIVRRQGGFPAEMFAVPPERVFCARPPSTRGGAERGLSRSLSFSPDSASGRATARLTPPINVAEAAKAPLDMMAATVEAAPHARLPGGSARRNTRFEIN
jgi:hypothetical protein